MVSVDVVEDGQIIGGAKKGLPEQVATFIHSCMMGAFFFYCCFVSGGKGR